MRRVLFSVQLSLALLSMLSAAQAGFVDEESMLAAKQTAEATAAAAAQSGPTLDDFLRVVKNTLNKVKLDKDQPPLKKVTINLKTTTGTTMGGNIKLFVISFGGTDTSSSEETLNIDLSGELGKEADKTPPETPGVSSRLAATIKSAQNSLKTAGLDQNSKPLSTSGLSLTQKFIVKKATSAGVAGEFNWTIVPISIGLSGGRDKGYEHSIVFEFAKFDNAAKVKAAMADLKAKTGKLGAPKVEGKDLYFGTTKADNSVVDGVAKGHGGDATIFVKTGNEYVRAATTIKKADGSSAVGTPLSATNPAVAKIDKGEAYYGDVTVFGKAYVAGYEPINDASDAVIGAYFAGQPK